jgi:kelch-like protein 19
VIDACSSFLERQLDPSNAIGIATYAQQHGCEDLFWKAQHFIERYFTQVRDISVNIPDIFIKAQ